MAEKKPKLGENEFWCTNPDKPESEGVHVIGCWAPSEAACAAAYDYTDDDTEQDEVLRIKVESWLDQQWIYHVVADRSLRFGVDKVTPA